MKQLATDQARHTFVAERDGIVIGFATVGPAENEALAGIGQLFAIYVEPAVVGDGVGRALIDEALAALRARGSVDGAKHDEVREGHVRHEVRYRRAL